MGMLLAPRFLSNMAAYTLKNAALFDGATGYLSFTLTTSATHSGSVWVQRAKLGAVEPVFDNQVYFNASDQLVVNGLTSTAVYRDPAGWLHIFWNASGAWVNGVAVTGTGVYATASITNPRLGFDGLNYAENYAADFAFFNGSSETLRGGKTDSVTGNWISSSVSGSPHTYLKFANAAGLGDNDGSGAAWTVTGGVSQGTSTPTNIFCTLNPIDISSVWNTPTTDGNLGTPGSNGSVCRTIGGTLFSEAPFYFEGSMISGTTYPNAHTYFGVGPVDTAGTSTLEPANSKGWFASPWNAPLWGQVGLFALAVQSYFAHAYTASSVWMCAADPTVGYVWFGVDGTWFNSGNPATGANPTFTGLPATLKPYYGSYYSRTDTGLVYNFGASPFAFAAPTGFGTLSTDSLPARAPKTPATPQTGSFTGNANAEGPFINLGMAIDTAGVSTINGNVITWGTHADATAVGVKIRTALATYNAAGANTYSFAVKAYSGGANVAEATAQGNP